MNVGNWSVRSRRVAVAAVVLALASTTAAACGEDDDDGAAATTTAAAAGGTGTTAAATGPGAFAKANYTTDLSDVCPATIPILTDWFPEPEHGALYQLIGAGGKTDADKGTYSGPLGSTGVNLEIRAGGPFLGNQTVVSLMYQDDDIFAGFVSTDTGLQFSGSQPTVAVVSPLEISPQILMWDPAQFQFKDFADIGKSNAKVLVFNKRSTYVRFLVGQGLIPDDKFDDSYDGSPSRFVAEKGIVQQGFATNEVYKYEHEIEQWNKPVDYLLIKDAGYDYYQSPIAVRTDLLDEERPCLEKLVPLIQQAQIDYINDPLEVNDQLLETVDKFASYWTLTAELNADAVDKMLELGIVSDGADKTLGNFDEARVQKLIDQLLPLYAEQNIDSFKKDAKPADIMTNEFIDPSISLGK